MHEHDDSLRVLRCGFCEAIFYVCRRCDRGHVYCGGVCRSAARVLSRRAGNRKHQRSKEGRRDHADHQAAIKWASMLATVAARIERFKTLSRTTPEQPATVELTDVEVRALILLKQREKERTETVPNQTPTIGQAVRWIGDLGGYVGNRSNGPPGSIIIARGLERVSLAADILQQLDELGLLKKIG